KQAITTAVIQVHGGFRLDPAGVIADRRHRHRVHAEGRTGGALEVLRYQVFNRHGIGELVVCTKALQQAQVHVQAGVFLVVVFFINNVVAFKIAHLQDVIEQFDFLVLDRCAKFETFHFAGEHQAEFGNTDGASLDGGLEVILIYTRVVIGVIGRIVNRGAIRDVVENSVVVT